MSRTFAQDKPLRRALFLAAVWVSLVLGDPADVWAQRAESAKFEAEQPTKSTD